MSIYPKFYFRPARGEQVTTVIRPEEEASASICGVITDSREKAVDGALVLLFRSGEGAPELLARCVSDDDGHFMFGPLEPESLYLIKVFKNSTKLRQIEVRAD